MENKVQIVKFNPKEWLISQLKFLNNITHDFDIPWIVFDKDIEPEYRIIRSSSHDGSLLFTEELICEAVEPLLKMTTCYKLTQPEDSSTVKEIHYTVGELELKTEFGMVDLPIGRYPRQTDTVTIPVRCEYIYK
jgi:hypothetical protein